MSTVADTLKQQAALWNQVERFIVNFKKSSKERLSSEGYLRGRMEKLDDFWSKFSENDLYIHCEANEEDRDCAYFKGDLLDRFETLYFEYKGIILDALRDISRPPAPPQNLPPSTSGNDTPIRNPQTNNNNLASERPLPATQGAPVLNSATVTANNHMQANNDTQPNVNDPILSTSINQSSFELQYNDIKLPRITIPRFSGDYRNWLSFYDLFVSMVHSNDRMPLVQKMQYLKSSLGGEAEQIIKHLNITAANYHVAWDSLCRRYQNPKILVNHNLKVLLTQPHIRTESGPMIRRLLDSTNECLSALKNLNVNINGWDPIINYLLVDRLPNETRQLWEQNQGSSISHPELSELKDFLEARFRTLEIVNPIKPQYTLCKNVENRTRAYHTIQNICPSCQGTHTLKECPKFEKMSVPERCNFVKSQSLCFNCLAASHIVHNCKSKFSCRICRKRHNSLLHSTAPRAPPPPEPQSMSNFLGNQASSIPNSTNSNVNTYFSREGREVLLATILVRIQSSTGQRYIFRALVDPGSQASFITNNVVQRLVMKTSPFSTQVSGLGNTVTAQSYSSVNFKMQPYNKENPSLEVRGIILSSLTDYLPSQRIPSSHWSHIDGLNLADPSYSSPGKIDIMLGAEIYSKILQNGLVQGPPGTPTAQNTSLGWILFGEVSSGISDLSKTTLHSLVVNLCSQVQECNQLKRFWELEEMPPQHIPSSEENFCENHFLTTHTRNPDGRYVVRLPFVPLPNNEAVLGDSRRTALSRFLSLERQLKVHPTLRSEYNKCLKEYEDLHHMERIHDTGRDCCPERSYYLPHHAVIKADSLTTRTRVVFDASSKSTNGYSLNDRLLPGPPLQRDIALLLFQWRQKKFVFNSDIARMYRQILIHPEDQNFQRIWWRHDANESPQEYRLRTVTFGVSSAPFLAMRTLHQLAKDEGQNFPKGAHVLLNDLYVDDVFSGGNTLEEAREVRREVDSILKLGGFQLRKWAANNNQLLDGVPEDQCSSMVLLNKENVIKTLGIYWSPLEEKFSIKITIKCNETLTTKRKILSEIARIYDPLGWLAPVVVTGKIFIQSLWQRGLKWDEPVPNDISIKWHEFLISLPELEQISIPRRILVEPKTKVQMHGFSDASERAYGAALYLRTMTNSYVQVQLITAKTIVAPLKTISLPRLELCGAVLVSKL